MTTDFYVGLNQLLYRLIAERCARHGRGYYALYGGNGMRQVHVELWRPGGPMLADVLSDRHCDYLILTSHVDQDYYELADPDCFCKLTRRIWQLLVEVEPQLCPN